MGIITEHIGASEEVIVVLREEGMKIAPGDMQCVAQSSAKDAKEGDRCEKDKYWDEESDTWMITCKRHTTQDNKARNGKGTPAVRVA